MALSAQSEPLFPAFVPARSMALSLIHICQKVVVVEDLISTGGSAIEVVEALREAGAEVLGIVSIFTYGMEKGLVRMADANVKNFSLSDFDTIVQVAADTGYIKQEDVKRLLAFLSLIHI